ncbi:MAG TPA: acetyl-coenzyme A synthetase N-terminal domain-containing protein, partial [Thalassobaculum sp.]
MGDDAIKLWEPSEERRRATRIAAFMAAVNARFGAAFSDYDALWRWSVDRREDFWESVWDFGGVVGDKGGRRLVDGDAMPGARFFPDARLNFAENLLRRDGDGDAIVFWGEDKVRRRMSWGE